MAVHQPTCSILDCQNPIWAKGLCSRHYRNKRFYGHYAPVKEWPLIARLVETGWGETERGCWEWRGNRNNLGYALISIGGRGTSHKRVSRLMWQMHNGPIADGAVVRHRCDNPPCVNPDHLEVGSKKQNSGDMVERDRSLAYATGRYGGVCKNGLHDVTLPGALILVVNTSGNPGHRCLGCIEAGKSRKRAAYRRRMLTAQRDGDDT